MKRIYIVLIAILCFYVQFIFPYFRVEHSPMLRFLSNGLVYLIVPYYLLNYGYCKMRTITYFFVMPSLLLFLFVLYLAISDNSYMSLPIVTINLFSLLVVYVSYKFRNIKIIIISFVSVLVLSYVYELSHNKYHTNRKVNSLKYPIPMTKIQVDKVYDFGEIAFGDTITHKFKIKNFSQRELMIRKIGTTCVCTTVGKIDSIIKPKDSSFIKIRFIPKKHQKGNISSSVVLDMNTNPSFTVLKMIGYVK